MMGFNIVVPLHTNTTMPKRARPRMQLHSKPARVRVPMPRCFLRNAFEVPNMLMHIIEKQRVRRFIRSRSMRFVLAMKRVSKPFPILPAPLAVRPSQELRELRMYVQVNVVLVCFVVLSDVF